MPNGTQSFEYKLGTEFFKDMESSDIFGGDVNVQLTVRNANGIYYLDFKINGTVTILCDRCLDEMQHEVETTYNICVKYGEEYCDDDDKVLIIPESDRFLNVAHLINDSIELTIPLKHVHPEGQCNEEMSKKLQEHSVNETDDEGNTYAAYEEDEEDNATDPRWDALKKIKDNN